MALAAICCFIAPFGHLGCRGVWSSLVEVVRNAVADLVAWLALSPIVAAAFVSWIGLTSMFCVIGTYHNPLIVLFLPRNTVLPLYRTSTPVPHLWNFISHPALLNHTIDRRECLMPGITCAFLAAAGSPGTSRKPSCVLLAFSPFATVTTMGFLVFLF